MPSRWVYAVPVAVVGTLLLVWGKRRWGDIPHTTRDVLGALKRGEAITYHTAWRDLLIALIILAAGAGVGPEASLMGGGHRVFRLAMRQTAVPAHACRQRLRHADTYTVAHALPSHAMD